MIGYIIVAVLLLAVYFLSEDTKKHPEHNNRNCVLLGVAIGILVMVPVVWGVWNSSPPPAQTEEPEQHLYAFDSNAELLDYVRSKYTPTDVWEDVIILQEHTFGEIASEEWKDSKGHDLWTFVTITLAEQEQASKDQRDFFGY